MLGAGECRYGSAHARNVDLQATVTEVRPDGKETFVQNGWLRTEARVMERTLSTLTSPSQPSARRMRDAAEGRFVKVVVPLYYQGHVYRAGSRVRVSLSAPGGDQPIWAFAEAAPDDTPWVAVAHTRKLESQLVLPVIDRFATPTPLPPCPGLRGEPCRDYVPFENDRFGKG